MNDGMLLTCLLVSCVSAAGIIFSRNVFTSVMLLLTCCLALAGVFGTLGAPYLLIAQIAVYGGGVVVLFLFAIMIAGKKYIKTGQYWSFKGLIPPLLLLTFLIQHLPESKSDQKFLYTAEQTGKLLASSYLFPFELSGVLLLVALIAAISISIQKPESNAH